MRVLNPEIKYALEKMDFINKAEELARDYYIAPDDDNRLNQIVPQKVIEVIKGMGYTAIYNKKEKFFKINMCPIEEKNLQFNIHLALRYGIVEFIWVLYRNEELRVGRAWGDYPRLLINPDYRIKYPVVHDYTELREVLKVGFAMFQEFQDLVIEYYEKEGTSHDEVKS